MYSDRLPDTYANLTTDAKTLQKVESATWEVKFRCNESKKYKFCVPIRDSVVKNKYSVSELN